MPERQRDARMAAVTNRAADEDTRVASHHPPVPTNCVGIALNEGPILVRRETVRVTVANVNRLAAAAEEFFRQMRLAGTTTERPVVKDEFFIHHQRRSRHEEPFALTTKGAVLARVTLADET